MAKVEFGARAITINEKTGKVISVTSPGAILAVGIQDFVNTKEFKPKLNGQTLEKWMEKEFYEWQKKVNYRLAVKARNIMRDWLKVGGTYDIGFSGGSAANLEVSHSERRVGKNSSMYYVYEKDSSKANKFIRNGLNPGAPKSDHQPFAKRVEWVKFRGLEYYPEEDEKDEFGQVKKDKAGELIVSKEEQARRTAGRVWNSIKEKGASTWYTQQAFTEGRPFFNYPEDFTSNHRADIQAELRRIADGERKSWEADVQGIVVSTLIASFSSVRKKWGTSGVRGEGIGVPERRI